MLDTVYVEVKECLNTYTNSALWMHGMTTMDLCPSNSSMQPTAWVKPYSTIALIY